MVHSRNGDDGQDGRRDLYDVDHQVPSSLLAASEPGGPWRPLGASAGASQMMEPPDDATDTARAVHLMTDPGLQIDPSSAEPIDRSDRHTSSVLAVPITWLDLTPPNGSLHLKLMEARDAYRAHIWSRGVSPDEQMAWARSQGGWSIRDEYYSGPYVVSFTVDSLPAGLAWLAELSSYQHLALYPDGTAHLHLLGLRKDIQEVHRRLRRATEIEVVRVADAEEEDVPVRGPRLTTAQRAAIEVAYEAGFFEVPRRTGLDELAEDLGRSRSSVSTLLRRGVESLVEHLLGKEDRSVSEDGPVRPAPKDGQDR